MRNACLDTVSRLGFEAYEAARLCSFFTMPVLGMGRPLNYDVAYSCRFNSADSARITWTPSSSASSDKKGSLWAMFKLGTLGTTRTIISARDSGGKIAKLELTSSDTLRFYTESPTGGAGHEAEYATTQLLRDVTAWYGVLLTWDTTLATPEVKLFLWKDNETDGLKQVTAFGTSTMTLVQNDAIVLNQNGAFHAIGAEVQSGTPTYGSYFNGYMSGLFGISDGTVWATSDVSEADGSGSPRPKNTTGLTYGTNGDYWLFDDRSNLDEGARSAHTYSMNGLTSADQVTDTPTNNFATLNPLVPSAASISDGNLVSGTTAVQGTQNAIVFNSYWEVTAGGSGVTAGVISETGTTNTTTITANKTFGFRLSTAGALDYINITDAGTWTSVTTGLSGQQFPYGTAASATWEFGQGAFVGSVPSTYTSLCTANLPTPASAASVTPLTGSFTGNASTDGPFVWLGYTPDESGTCTINGNAITWGTHARAAAGGFKIITSSSSYNASGSNSYSIAVLHPFGGQNTTPATAR